MLTDEEKKVWGRRIVEASFSKGNRDWVDVNASERLVAMEREEKFGFASVEALEDAVVFYVDWIYMTHPTL